MSTILDALKRLEDKSQSQEDQSVPGAMRGRRGTAGRRGRMLAGGAVGLLVMGAALAVYWGYGQWASRSSDKKGASAVSAPAAVPVPGQPISVPPGADFQKDLTADRRPAPPTKSTKSTADSLNAPADVDRSADKSVRKPKHPVPVDLQKYVKQDPSARNPQGAVDSEPATPAGSAGSAASAVRDTSIAPSTNASQAKTKPAQKPVREAASAPALPARDPYANTELLPKGELTLQAISWSDMAGERITIINSRILREGQTVDGYAVVQIRPDHVIMSKAERYWRLGYDN